MLRGASLFMACPALGEFVRDDGVAAAVRVFDKVSTLVWAMFGEEVFGLAFVLLAAGAGGTD